VLPEGGFMKKVWNSICVEGEGANHISVKTVDDIIPLVQSVKFEVCSSDPIGRTTLEVLAAKIDIVSDAEIIMLEWSEDKDKFVDNGKRDCKKVRINTDGTVLSTNTTVEDVESGNVLGNVQKVTWVADVMGKCHAVIEMIDIDSYPKKINRETNTEEDREFWESVKDKDVTEKG
jgi:hypothetical protein